MSHQTIFALASAAGRAAVAVIRISGGNVRFVVETMAGRILQPRVATLVHLRDAQGQTLDQGLVLWFPAPHSFTGEDCAEFQLHGSRAVVAAVLRALAGFPGCRLAEPGEFSRRAFLNGKLDLAQAEGLADLIDAETESQRRQALRQLDGVLGDQAERWRQEILHLQAIVEADIDFSDEGDVSAAHHDVVVDSATKLINALDQALEGYRKAAHVQQGVYIVIAGAPNVGKSSLLNRFAQREAAIVSSEAGTTRDIIEISMQFHDYLVTFADTAGIRETHQMVEQMGIARARQAVRKADLVLWLDDGSFQSEPPLHEVPVLRIQTKQDLHSELVPGFDLTISTISGFGLETLERRIQDFLESFPQGSGLITRERHHAAALNCRSALQRVRMAEASTLPEMIAEDLRMAAFELGRIIGHHGVEDILGALFSTFCIGK